MIRVLEEPRPTYTSCFFWRPAGTGKENNIWSYDMVKKGRGLVEELRALTTLVGNLPQLP